MPRTVAIVQARMGSTRLPGKVLKPLAGHPMLARVVSRVRRAACVDEVVVATTTEPADDAIVQLCAEQGWACFRGSEWDVLDRYYQAAKAHDAEVVVRITSDCPLIDPQLIEPVVAALETEAADYASNVVPHRSYPRGLDTEVCTFAALETAWREDADPTSREHVTTFIYRNPDRFRCHCLTHPSDESAHRWTVDTPEDYALVERIYAHFGHDRFGWQEVLALLQTHPEWANLNAHIEQKVH